jgi:polypeptide N-acetylgalactosaminyltransferase
VISVSFFLLFSNISLFDDFSAHLGEPLQKYVDDLDKVKLLRAPKREGLIRARLLGAENASGDILIFLDSHCECADGWLEPLVDPIARNPNVTTMPIIEIINDNTFEFESTSIESVQVGGFDWDLLFDWHGVPKYEMVSILQL